MKTSFVQYVADMNKKHNFRRRLISMLCVLSLLVSAGVSLMLTMPGLTASLDPAVDHLGVTGVVTDVPTHNAWREYFKINPAGSSTIGYTTEFVGSVWTDKSTFTEYTTSKGQVISAGTHNMLGVLSAIGSSMAITGRIRTPTDTIFVLDLSSSMYGGDNRNASAIKEMVNAVNTSITRLLTLNDVNRIGVVVYWGGNSTNITWGSTLSHGEVLLDLDRYEVKTSGELYLTVTPATGKITGVKASAKSMTSGKTITKTHEVKSVEPGKYIAGTYAQLGLQIARDQFLAVEDTTVQIGQETTIRQPIFIFMSDGRPTASHSNYATLTGSGEYAGISSDEAEWGLNTEDYRTSDASDFVFQLTAAYSKLKVHDHYSMEPLFYTLGLESSVSGKGVSLNVMDPVGTDKKTQNELDDQTQIKTWWEQLIGKKSTEESVKLSVYTNNKDYSWSGYTAKFVDRYVYPVNITLKNNTTVQFPNDINQQNYVDRYFSADNAKGLPGAFEQIVNEIILKSIYAPTNVTSGREHTTGDVSFVDQIGQYMEVKDIRGILLHGNLHTGEGFAKTLTTMGDLGDANEFGMAFWNNIIEQLGLDHVYKTVDDNGLTYGPTVEVVAKTRELIQYAWDHNQLACEMAPDGSVTSWSNYIGWYANDDNEYLGFWDGTDTINPEHLIPNATTPTQRIKTYFFQDPIEANDILSMKTDLMYITVWVKEDIATGVETVVFSVPSSLIPTLKYFVKLNEYGDLESFHLGAVEKDTVFNDDGTLNVRPVRLVYEVGLQSGINAQNLLDIVDSQYLEQEKIVQKIDDQGNLVYDENGAPVMETLKSNVNPETGEVYFYSNEWQRTPDERNQYTGYGTPNTYSYFYPSQYNDRYYYIEDADIYCKENGDYVIATKANHAELLPSDDLYTKHVNYVREGDRIYESAYYMPLGDTTMTFAQTRQATVDGESAVVWYIPANVAHSLDINGAQRFYRYKPSDGDTPANPTGTLMMRNVPHIDTRVSSGSTLLLAASLGNNGRIAVEPKGQVLQKQLVKEDGSPYVAERDQTFQFLIHEGPALTDAEGNGIDYNDGNAVAAALGDKKVSILPLTVSTGNSVSGVKTLSGLTEYTWDASGGKWNPKNSAVPTWDCTYQETYTVVELNTNDRFAIQTVSETYRSEPGKPELEFVSKESSVYQFVYGQYPTGDEDHVIAAVNKFNTWEIELTKIDSEVEDNKLPGAVFGLYSLKDSDAMSSEALAAGYPDLDYAAVSAAKAVNPATITESTWYLSQIGTTDANGQIVWSGLTQEEYLIVELQPPPGYYRPAEDAAKEVVQRSTSNDPNRLLVTVTNTPGYEMPSTGGAGTLAYIFIGSALMLASAVAMVVYHSRRKEERIST